MAANGTKSIVDIPASGATWLPVVATGPLVYLRVTESTLTSTGAPNAAQGWNYRQKNDGTPNGFTTAFPVVPTVVSANAVLEMGDKATAHGSGSIIGLGPDSMPGAGSPPRAATVLFQAQSQTGTGTSLLVEQFYS